LELSFRNITSIISNGRHCHNPSPLSTHSITPNPRCRARALTAAHLIPVRPPPSRSAAALKRPKLPSPSPLKTFAETTSPPTTRTATVSVPTGHGKRRRLLYIQNAPGNTHWSRAIFSRGSFLAAALRCSLLGPGLVELLGHAHRYFTLPQRLQPAAFISTVSDCSPRPATTTVRSACPSRLLSPSRSITIDVSPANIPPSVN